MLQRTIRRLTAGAAAALAFCLPAAGTVVVDDLEDGDGKNVFGYYWYTYQSGYAAAIELTPSGDFVPADGGASGSAKFAAALDFKGLGSAPGKNNKGEDLYPEIGMGTPLTESETAGFGDGFKNVDSVAFWAKGPGGLKFNFYVHTVENAPNSNDNKYGKLITISTNDANKWIRYSFSLKPVVPTANPGAAIVGTQPAGKAGALTQALYYGNEYTFDPVKATRLSWTIKKADNTTGTTNPVTNPASGVFAVDDIALIGGIALPAPAVKYALTYKVNSEAGGRVVSGNEIGLTRTDSVAAGAKGPKVTARASDAYYFEKWDDGLADTSRTDSAVGDKVFTAIFKQKRTITYIAGANGDLSIEGLGMRDTFTTNPLVPGERGPRVTAIGRVTPKLYQFKSWNDGNEFETRSDAAADVDQRFTAEFEEYVAPLPVVNVKYLAGEGGGVGLANYSIKNITCTGFYNNQCVTSFGSSVYIDSLLAPGDSVTVKAVPDSGYNISYKFLEWDDGVKTAIRTDKYEDGPIQVTALFVPVVSTDPERVYFTLRYTAGEGGRVKADGDSSSNGFAREIDSGSAGPAVTALPDSGYRFVKWSDGLTSDTRSDTAKADTVFRAEFAFVDTVIKTYRVFYVAGEGGKLRVNDNTVYVSRHDTTVAAGTDAATIVAMVDSGYIFVKWTSGSTAGLQRFNTNVQADLLDTAVFALRTAVAASDREIPAAPTVEVTAIAPVAIIAGELTAGPNPASAAVNFFRTGRAIKAGKLAVYDASGELVTTVSLSDKGTNGKRPVGSWNLKDNKGRQVANGSYAVKGTVTTKDGVKEKVSTIIAVAK